jgi:hypothetical protein
VRSASGSTVTTVAPNTAPLIEPMPPITIMTMISIERTKFRFCGLSGLANSCPDSPPATPARAALMTNAITLYRVVLIPIASAAISSPRIMASTRPNVEVAMLRTMTMVSTATAKIQKKLMIGSAAVNPVAPPTAGMLRMMTRMISENPSVTMAR